MKIFIFSILTLILFAVPAELLCRLSNSWEVQSALPRLYGIVPLENMLYAFINFFWVLSFYKYFVDRDGKTPANPRWKWLLTLYALFFCVTLGLFFLQGEHMAGVPYWIFGIAVLFIPSLFIYRKKPKLLQKTILPTIFFAVVFFIHEAVSLAIGYWWWPGTYLWSVNLSGHVFPLDDVLMWYLLSTPALIAGYEFFDDDFE